MFLRLLRVTVTFASLLALVFKPADGQRDFEHRSRELHQDGDVNWPPLRFDFILKRSSMQIFGQSSFSMFANPLVSSDGASVIYNTFVASAEGSTLYNYTLVHGIGLISKSSVDNNTDNSIVKCLEPESGNLPPINTIASAINAATATSGSGNSKIRCSTDHLFELLINGIDFSLCASGSGLKMYGDDMHIAVRYMESPVNIPAPDARTNTCRLTASPISVTSIGRSLLTGKLASADAERELRSEFDFTFWSDDSDDESQHSSSSDSSRESERHGCTCKSTPRPCLFIHGMGIDHEEATNVDSFSYYWGNLTDHAPCCSSIKYTVLDTVNNSWTDDTQQQKVCDRALAVSDTSVNSTITDTILVTHSMGNLMLAGTIASGKCSLDSSSTWVGLAGPMKGSMGSDFVQASCAGETNDVLESVADITGKCPPTTALVSLAYQGERFSSTEHNAAYTAAQKAYKSSVYALMCSEGYSGLVSKYQAEGFQSCAAGIPESQFGDTWRSRFYKTKLNHYDSEFLYGDGLLSEYRSVLLELSRADNWEGRSSIDLPGNCVPESDPKVYHSVV